jgi:penicillin-binding protein 1C
MTCKNARRLSLALLLLVILGGGIRLWPKPPLADSYSSSTAVYDADGRLLRLTLSSDEKYRLWMPLARISPTLIAATLLHEDQHFYRHPGVDPAALMRSAWRTYIAGGRRQGGSTLTMQLARIRHDIDSRTIAGKLLQIVRAVQLELCYSKDEILEAYLNLAPFGRNVEGVGAASLIYFGKPASQLALPESLTLAVIPQSPVRRSPGKEDHGALTEARSRLYMRWTEERGDQDREMMKLPIRMRDIEALPFRAPHLVDSVLTHAQNEKEIAMTIDGQMQRILERQVQRYVATQQRVGIHNAAAMLIDYRLMEVKALVGSADFFSNTISGQVNGAQAKRSPGSTLKPFVYALGIDQGVLHPMTVLRDAPTAFGPFSPENFDGHFAGPITAKDALIKSRNIPAVQVSARLSKPSLYDFLKNAGVSNMRSEAHYGLALVLGGGEVTMEELVTLYAVLANHGELKPLRYLVNDPKPQGVQLLSDEASFITLDMLQDNPRPQETYVGAPRLPVAWKTGTSYGFRDAWSVGIFGHYVLAVWIGNFNGDGNPAFIGLQAAAPLFFQIVDGVVADKRQRFDPPINMPKNLARVEVCAASGDLPNTACPLTTETWFIPGKSPIRISEVHRRLAIDTRTGLEACPPYDPAHTRFEVYEFWPSDMQKLFTDAGMPRRVPPGKEPACETRMTAGTPPRITSPLRGVRYTLRSQNIGTESITLQATSDGDASEVFWFIDETFLGKAKSGAGFAWQPQSSGEFTLRAVDNLGRTDARALHVEAVQ